MTLDEVKAVVNTNYSKEYRVKLTNGKSKIVRLWLYCGEVAIMGRNKRKYGHYIWRSEVEDWVSIKEVTKEDVDYKKRLMLRARAAQKMLAESGLWPDIKKEIDDFLALSDEKIDEYVKAATTDFYENVYCHLHEEGNKFPWLHTSQIFSSFLSKRCWKSLNFGRWYHNEKTLLKEAIENKKNYNLKWENGYDNSVEVSFKDEKCPRGWYSEEYRGCGNGHYYLLFDATHAIYYEDD